MKTITLSKGLKTKVDQEDFLKFGNRRWYAKLSRAGGNYYAVRCITKDGKRRRFSLHREILNCPKDMAVDHINGNTLDNRKENLRIAFRYQNAHNHRLFRKTGRKSNFSGVTKLNKRWKAGICVLGVAVNLGCFSTEQEAAKAYDIASQCLVRKFSNTNFRRNKKLDLLLEKLGRL